MLPDPIIFDYIRANRGEFSREAIDGELLASGHTPEAIAAAWAAIEAEELPAPPPDDAPPSSLEPANPGDDQSVGREPLPQAPEAPDAPPDPVILGYIRDNRGSFSRPEIERELLASGHQSEEIARAWAEIEAEESALAPATGEADYAPFIPLPPVAPQPETDPLVPVVAPLPSEGRDPAIDRYIREHRSIYTRPAVTDSLLASGHSRADIDAAWAAVAAAEAPPPLPPEPAGERRSVLSSWRFWVTAAITAIAQLVLPVVFTIAFPDQPIGVGAGCVLMIAAVAAGLILLGIGKARDVAYGLLAGVGALFALSIILTLLAFILVIVVIGACFVILGQQGLSP